MQHYRNLCPLRRSAAPRRVFASLLAGCLLGLGLAGCGAAVEGKATQEPGAEPETVGDETARFDQAERDLRSSLGITTPDRREDSGPGLATHPAPPGESPPAPPPRGGDRAHETSNDQGRCVMACRALESMERSAERLCSLAGEQDQRCAHVRQRVIAARRLVRQWCPDCQP